MCWFSVTVSSETLYEPPHDKTNIVAVRPAKAQNPPSLIRVSAVRMKKGWMDELGFYVPSTVFQSFRDDERVNMKGSVQSSAV